MAVIVVLVVVVVVVVVVEEEKAVALLLSDAPFFQLGLNHKSEQSAMNTSYPVNLRHTTAAKLQMMRLVESSNE